MIDALTDNKNRTTAEIRNILTKSGGNLGENGCVSWIFEKKGVITVNAEKYDEDTVMELALDTGADDVKSEDDVREITTSPEAFEDVSNSFREKGIEMLVNEVMRVPSTTIKLDTKSAERILHLMEKLEDADDVQNVAANFDIPNEVMQTIAQ